ncbi:unnamed protein product [Acanthosepion pharaonis]|uniref:Uncharacterized protein n=1 Tax=Acanthosepion pharaonis TaxID=158019 RepID=A0A812CQB6_ACAPH|nr:unnamed protein product [Sepia pharaonis]
MCNVVVLTEFISINVLIYQYVTLNLFISIYLCCNLSIDHSQFIIYLNMFISISLPILICAYLSIYLSIYLSMSLSLSLYSINFVYFYFEMEEELNPKPYSYPFGKMSATVRRNSEYFMKDASSCDKQQMDLAVVPGDHTMNLWSAFPCEAETTLYDSNLDPLNIQTVQEFKIAAPENNTENCRQKQYSEPLPHPTKLRKKRKSGAKTMKWPVRKDGNIHYHLSQLKSKQVVRMGQSQLSQKLNETKEFPYSQYQKPESISSMSNTIWSSVGQKSNKILNF